MIETKIGKEIGKIDNIAVDAALIGWIRAKEKIAELNKELSGYKETLVEAAEKEIGDRDSATITLKLQENAIKITFGWDAKIKDEDGLRKILDERFYDLVSETIVQKPEKKLKEMALEDDGIRECLEIKAKTPALSVVKAS